MNDNGYDGNEAFIQLSEWVDNIVGEVSDYDAQWMFKHSIEVAANMADAFLREIVDATSFNEGMDAVRNYLKWQSEYYKNKANDFMFDLLGVMNEQLPISVNYLKYMMIKAQAYEKCINNKEKQMEVLRTLNPQLCERVENDNN